MRKVSGDICPAQTGFSPSVIPTCREQSCERPNLELGALLWRKTKSLLKHILSLNSATGKTKSLLNILNFLFFFILLSGMTSNKTEPIESTVTYHSDTQKKDQPDPYQKVETIKIGLLLPISPDKDLLAKSALQGAELAVQQANRAGGYKGQLFELVIRTADGLWGAGSKESVDFVHEDKVVAIVTALDGRNAHLVEQVAAKSHVVQVATRATEETLSQAYVPWFFRIVPNDNQQAEALIKEMYENQGLSQVHLIYEEDYDYINGAKSFKKISKKNGFKLSGETVLTSSESDDFTPQLKSGTDGVIVFGKFRTTQGVLDRLKVENPSILIYGSSTITADGLIGSEFSEGCEGGIFISSKFCFTTPGQAFKDAYMVKYERMPNPAASYAFDGIGLIVEAIKQVGTDREKIRDVLKEINYLKAATGPIQFDKNGNRTSPVFLIRMIKGHPVILNP